MNALTMAQPARLRPRHLLRRRPDLIFMPLLVIALLVLWEAIVSAFNIRTVILPRPTAIARELVLGFQTSVDSRAGYYIHIFETLKEVVGGYVIGCSFGLVVATVIAQSLFLERLIKPLVIAFQSVPKIALAPLVIVWFGFGINSKIVLVILSTFFPILINALVGLKSVDQERIDLMRAFAATRWQIFRKVTFPTALPFIFAGLEVALVYALTSAIVAEFLGGQIGLGVLITQMEQILNATGIFAVLVILGCVGALLNFGLGLVRRKVLFWAPSEQRAERAGAGR